MCPGKYPSGVSYSFRRISSSSLPWVASLPAKYNAKVVDNVHFTDGARQWAASQTGEVCAIKSVMVEIDRAIEYSNATAAARVGLWCSPQ